MPEGPEIHRFASLVNAHGKKNIFFRVVQAKTKSAPVEIPWSEFHIEAVARGKELQLTFTPARELAGAVPVKYLFTHGLVGMWHWISGANSTPPMGTLLTFHGAQGCLVFTDKMKMGSWVQTNDWGKARGPDAMLEFFAFCRHVVQLVRSKKPSAPIVATLADQSYFNGVGNYLRAEILNRAGLDPFQLTTTVFANTPIVQQGNLTPFAEIMKEASSPNLDAIAKKATKHDPGLLVLWLARQVQMEVLTLDLNKYGDADQLAKFNAWLKVYDKAQEVRVSGRTVHCTPEQRLGVQERHLGTFVNRYPFTLAPGLFYVNPTLTIAPQDSSTMTGDSAAPQPLTQQAPQPSSAFNIKRIEENILPCSQIVELPIPMISKLLMATTSLSRRGKLNFSDEASIRETILDEHPMCFSAWQVFEINDDEDDLIDTLKKVALSTAHLRQERDAYIAYLSAQVATINIPQQVPTSLHHPTHTDSWQSSMSGAQKEPRFDSAPTLSQLDPKQKLPTKKVSHKRLASDSSSATDSGSVGSEEAVQILNWTAKKKKLDSVGRGKQPKANKFDPPANLKSGGMGGFGKATASTSAMSSKKTSGLDLASMIQDDSWATHLRPLLKKGQMPELAKFLEEAYARNDPPVYPAAKDLFNAFNCCPLDRVKVVILGQDPYHGPGQAHGLCFSILRPEPAPPSLVNIFKELESDVPGFKIPSHGDLTYWATQGVLLLNTVLSVYKSKPLSHAHKGWEGFTSAALQAVLEKEQGVVFLLWGASAIKHEKLIKRYPQHHILQAPHPSPLSAFHGWFGCKHFSKTNRLLLASGLKEIDWQIPE